MLMNMTAVYASLSATMLRKTSGQNALLSGPPRHLFDFSAASRSLRTSDREVRKMASRANQSNFFFNQFWEAVSQKADNGAYP